MDAIKFVKTLQMKFKDENRDEIIIRTTDDAGLLVDLVEEWAKEHPAKTRQSVFLEQYPDASIGVDGVLKICPMLISVAYRDSNGLCACIDLGCEECRQQFWMQEVE